MQRPRAARHDEVGKLSPFLLAARALEQRLELRHLARHDHCGNLGIAAALLRQLGEVQVRAGLVNRVVRGGCAIVLRPLIADDDLAIRVALDDATIYSRTHDVHR